MRLQKYLSEHGICSRRRAEEHILAGKIRVNGETVKVLGTKVDPDKDLVEYDSEVVETPQKLRYIILNKPYGVVTSCLQKGETTVKDLVECEERLFPVGRLDKDSTGLVLMTNDGTLAYRLMHPKFLHEKEYVVDTEEPVTEGMLEKLAHGVKLEGVQTAPCKIKKVGPRRFRIVLREGRNRQIRKMVKKVGTEVTKLDRIRIENVRLGSLPVGAWRELNFEEEYELFQRAGLVRHAEALKAANRKSPRKEPQIVLSAFAKIEKPKAKEEPREDYSSDMFEEGEEKVSFFPGTEAEEKNYRGAFANRKKKGERRTVRKEELESEIAILPKREEGDGEKRFERKPGFKRPARARNAMKDKAYPKKKEYGGYEERYGMGKPARDIGGRKGSGGGKRFSRPEKKTSFGKGRGGHRPASSGRSGFTGKKRGRS
ncbi:rRNA pseudouridine synthase [bacterium]|nr:rRNA pseudouridine synthase [bacterium]MBR6463373.1 rRNA pseudouridine synthase [bacterium]